MTSDDPMPAIRDLLYTAIEQEKTDQHPVRWRKIRVAMDRLIDDLGHSFTPVNLTRRR